jgi:hypothetical protein
MIAGSIEDAKRGVKLAGDMGVTHGFADRPPGTVWVPGMV